MLQLWRAIVAARGRLQQRAERPSLGAVRLDWQTRRQLLSEHGPGGLAAAHSRLQRAWAVWVQAATSR